MNKTEYDILIVGGGMVGASLALSLADSGLSIGVIEAVPFRSSGQPSYDDRAIALAQGTRRIFSAMGVWEVLEGEVTPIRHIHISDRGHFGATRLDARDHGVEALGYVVENRVLGRVLGGRLGSQANVVLWCPAKVENVILGSEVAEVVINTGDARTRLTGKLVVAADGTKSAVRDMLDIGVIRWEYGQTAVISNVTPGRPHDFRAFERFTDTGPLALLPMGDERCSLVWTVRPGQVDGIMALGDAAFLARLQERFGGRLGRFVKAGQRYAYPLAMVRAREHVRSRFALIGNAAHTLHPVAGQGFNLGLRDVAVLAQVVFDAARAGQDIGALETLHAYARWRQKDHLKIIGFTDGLARIFANPLAPVRWARGAGLLALELLPPAKRALARHTMGLAGRLPRLARGLPL
ncbi:MAG TPA: 2-octaprenyl-6-methoxyphenyl hydroxylase [Gammaproteobacteria bacterium]|nr:2-octaprenyl-6-methoxyphenyl hydroxylase [Gammaproteobacteria bacterium]